MASQKTKLFIAYAASLAVLAAAGAFTYRGVGQQREHALRLVQTNQVLTALKETLTDLVDTETGQRGYLLTLDRRYLEPYRSGLREVPADLRLLRRLTREHLDQTPRIDELEALVAAKLDELGRTIDLAGRDPAAARRVVLDNLGKQAMDRIRALVSGLEAEERGRLEAREREYRQRFLWTRSAVVLSALLGMAAMTGLLAALLAHLRARDRHQANLERNRQWLQVTLRSIGDALIATDTSGRVTFLNPVAEALTGWTEAEALGRPMDEVFPIVHEADGRPAINPMARVLSEGVVLGLANHTALVHRDGRRIPIQDSAAPILGPDRTVEGMVLVFQDLTAVRAAEEDRRQVADQLARAQKSQALAVLVAGVAHHFNNLLTVILGTASLWEDAAAEAEVREAFRTVTGACVQGRHLVQSLEHFSRPALSRPGPVDLARLVDDLDYLLANATRNRVRVVAEGTGAPAWVLGETGSLGSALMNLCLNGVDAMPGGGTLTLGVAAPEPGWVEVTVRDTGTGMAPDVLAQAMDPFFTTKPPGQGTGLGLSSAQAVAKAHGGSLTLDSTPGEGTTVVLRLPAARPPEPETPAPAAPPPAAAAGGVPPHVMLVDDDEDVRILTARLLSRSGVGRVETFASGEAFLARLAEGPPPTLVVLDQNMPGLTGAEVLERIRAGHPALPVLISSGQPDVENWSMFHQPFTGVINKPFTLNEMQVKLVALAGTGGAPSPQSPPAAAGLEEVAPALAGFARARLAEDALRASGERFARAFVDNPVAMVLTRLEDGLVLEVNHAWAALMGCRREEVIGRPVRAMDIWPSAEEGARFIGELRTFKVLHGREQAFRTLDGRRVETRVWSQVLEIHGVEMVLTTLIDFSESRRLQEELAALSLDLDRRVEDRSAEQIALSQEREAFSYAVSHDLRAPLRALSGYSQALVEDFGEAIPADARGYLQRIHLASRRMGELIDGLLAMARDSRGELIQRPVDLSELAEAVRRDLAQAEPGRAVDWRIEPGLRAVGDERLLKAVLANLLGNAWKYTQQRPDARIEFGALDRDGVRWFQVGDNGAGFDMVYASKLFTPFQRLHRPDEFPGLGIGLATVKRIIQRHGGSIEAEAEPGRGARFRFTLPG